MGGDNKGLRRRICASSKLWWNPNCLNRTSENHLGKLTMVGGKDQIDGGNKGEISVAAKLVYVSATFPPFCLI